MTQTIKFLVLFERIQIVNDLHIGGIKSNGLLYYEFSGIMVFTV